MTDLMTPTPEVDDKAPSWGRWIFWYKAPVAVLGVAQGLVGANAAHALPTVDSLLSKIADALRFVGLGVSRPGLDGPLGTQFYANQVAIATWRVFLCSCTSVLKIVAGRNPVLPLEAYLEREIRSSNWDRVRTFRWIVFQHLFLTIPFRLLLSAPPFSSMGLVGGL